MASLFNKQISATYKGLLKTTSNGELTSSLAQITDGSGNGSKLYLSTTTINFYNAYSFPSSDGSANQVLKTDGSGALTWQNDSVASTLNFSGSTSGTGSVALNTQTLAFTGTANQITAIAGSQAITFAFPAAGVTLPNGSVATTQSAGDDSTKVATTKYVDDAVAAGGTGNVNVSGTPSANQIAIWTNATTIKGMSTLTIDTTGKITLTQSNTNYNVGGGNLASVSGTFNTGFGEDNLNAITSGLRNTAFGYRTLKDLTIGTDNVAVGYTALNDATEAVECIAVGSAALSNVTTGHFNIGVGHNAGGNVTTSTRNTLVGRSAGSLLDTVSSGGYNTFIGYHSGLSVTSGSKNVILGSNTGSTIATSSNNIIISDGDGNARIQVDSGGRVGINVTPSSTRTLLVKGQGTTSSTAAFQVNDGNNADVLVIKDDKSATFSGDIALTGDSKIQATGDLGIGARNGTTNAGAVYIGGANDNPFISPTAFFGTDGKVGIGTTSPDFSLDIEANGGGVQLQLGRTGSNVGSAWMGADSNGFHLGVGAYGSGNSVSDPNGITISSGGDVTASNKKNSSTVTDKITTYAEEKIIEIYSTGSATLDIATIASGYVSGSLLIECSITGQFAAFASLEGSYRKAQVSFAGSAITVTNIDSYNGQVGNIDYTFVSHGSMKITLSSINHTSFGALNGIAYLRVIGGNTSNSSDVSPSGFTIS